jgi:pimeloyl-ACP methyl ester carboxylesterase
MGFAEVNGVRLAYQSTGNGEPVLLIMGSGARGRVWHADHVPALVDAGYSVVTFDHRGVPPSDVPPGPYRLEDLVADTGGLIEHLGLAPCRVAGVSMGSFIAQELMLVRPDLVWSAVLMATKARSDAARRAHSRASRALLQSGARLPPSYQAVNLAFQALSPETLNDDRLATQWLDMFEHFPVDPDVATAHQALDEFPDRRQALAAIDRPCLVLAFADDLVIPPHLGREVADAIPGCAYVELKGCGHFGYLERPDEVSRTLIEFFRRV